MYEAKSAHFKQALKVNLSALQRMVLLGMQKELVDEVGAMVTNGQLTGLDEASLNRIKASLAQYCMNVSVILSQ